MANVFVTGPFNGLANLEGAEISSVEVKRSSSQLLRFPKYLALVFAVAFVSAWRATAHVIRGQGPVKKRGVQS